MPRICCRTAVLCLLWCSSGAAQIDLAVRAQAGKKAMAEGKFAEAATIYSEVVRALPDDAGMRLNLGMALSMAGRVRDGMPHLQRAVDLRPGLTAAWLFLGANWLELGDAERAAAALTKAAAAEPGNTEAHALLGKALLAGKQFEAATVEFRTATEQQPASSRAWYGLGRSYEALARAAFAALEETDPESAYAMALRAEALVASRQDARARALYEQAIKLRPDFGPVRKALAELDGRRGARVDRPCAGLECEFLAGDHAGVVRRAAGQRTPEARYWLTRSYNELARAAFGTLSALPASPELHQFRGEMYTDQGRHVDAVEELRKALSVRPGDPALTKQLGAALYRAKSYDEAADVLERVAQREPSSEVLFLLGDTLLILGRSGEAVNVLERAVALDAGELPARASLGRAYLQQGNAAAAIPHLEAALAVDEDGTLHYQLARAYQAVGRADRAKEMLEKYAAILRRP